MVNKLKEVTNRVTFDRGNIPTPDGLLSTEIFGINPTEKKTRFAYIDLKTRLFHPVVYKSLLRMNRNIEYIVQGSKRFVIDNNGTLVENEDGETGITWLYNNWEKIKWERNDSRTRNSRIDLLDSFDKNVIFIKQFLVIPVFYRDVNKQDADGKVAVHQLTKMYSQLIGYASIVERSNGFDFMINITKYNMQTLLVDIYTEFKSKIEKKNGLIKKSLMGKTVDYGYRSVISAPRVGNNRSEDMLVTPRKSGIPVQQLCALLLPFISHWVKGFFRREFESSGSRYPILDSKTNEIKYIELKDPMLYFNEEYINKAIDRFIHSPYNRFDKIALPTKDGSEVFMAFKGRDYKTGERELTSQLINRPATWTDILYMAAVDVSTDKYVYITRYPISDITSGIFVTGISVLSTLKTMPMMVGNRVYQHYPVIDTNIDSSDVPSQFLESAQMSNVYLKAIGGDYDGDQITLKIPFTQEANLEAKKIMMSKIQLLNSYGKSSRITTNEMVQTLYMLTKREEA